MSFITPFIGPIVSGLVGHFAGKALAKPDPAQSQALNLANSAAQKGIEASDTARNQGLSLLSTGMGRQNQAATLFSGLLSGNSGDSTAALAPDIARIRKQNETALDTSSNLTPRGGGRSQTLFDLPFKTATQTSGLFNELRPQAATALAQIGGANTNTGAGLYGTGANYLSSGVNAAHIMGNEANTVFQQGVTSGQGLASLLTGAFGKVDWTKLASGIGGLFKGGGSPISFETGKGYGG